MNKGIRSISLFLAAVILFASCSSTTMIQSTPSKAKVYIDGSFVGETPYLHRDSKIVGSSMSVKLEKEGFNPLNTTITKDEDVNIGAIIGGLFVLVPFLWTMQYQPEHNYVLKPANETGVNTEIQKVQTGTKSKADKLRELKQLLDERIITLVEFEKEKAKILDAKE
ncbi:MAG: PEGA domain-containing protein [Paludibacter sp.]|nr:PEGA domain-containing protein [Paludibacter sp.]